MASDGVRSNPFCEACERWYLNAHDHAIFPTEVAVPLLSTLETRSPTQLDQGPARLGTARTSIDLDSIGSYLDLGLRRCSCDESDYELAAALTWQDLKETRGTEGLDVADVWSTLTGGDADAFREGASNAGGENLRIGASKATHKEHTEVWFKTMVPAALGRALEARFTTDAERASAAAR